MNNTDAVWYRLGAERVSETDLPCRICGGWLLPDSETAIEYQRGSGVIRVRRSGDLVSHGYIFRHAGGLCNLEGWAVEPFPPPPAGGGA